MAKGGTPPVPVRGGVYWVDDRIVTLLPRALRRFHNRRSVIVISSSEHCHDPSWPAVAVIPASSSPELVTPLCHRLKEIKAADGGPLWARVGAIQSLDKQDLQDRHAMVEAPELSEILARLVTYLDF